MARPLRMESESGVYHVLNRGNYRTGLFRADKTKEAFLQCLDEACAKTGWRVHAWCLMSNHYHLALSTPGANLVEGMRWLQGTFSARFNRFRGVHGHLFQGRYKSLIVDPDGGLGPLCHYIHLNPVRARLCAMEELAGWRWTSLRWILEPKLRPAWFAPKPALEHAGGLRDTPSGRKRYHAYLEWLAEDEPARKAQRFEAMSRGWIIGTREFARELIQEQLAMVGQGPRLAAELQEAREALWREALRQGLRRAGRKETALATTGKSEAWKLQLAAELKATTTVTNRWLGQNLHMGNLHEVSRKVAAWGRRHDGTEAQNTNPKA